MKGEMSTSTEVDALANLTALPGGTGLFIRKTGATTFENATEAGLGSVTQVSVVTANGVSGSVATASTTPAITLTLGDITPSSVTVSGLTASELVATNGTKVLTSLAVATYPSLTEISYVKGVTSGIQSQLNGKLATGLAVLLDQTTPQTITGGSPIIPSIDGSAADNGDLTLQGTSSATRTTSYVILQPNGGNVGIGTASPNQLLTVENSMSLKEIASANADTAAYGQIWVKSDTPNTLWFTNDAGTDVQLGVAIPIEGTAVLSTGEAGGTKFLREDGDGTCSWQTVDLSSKADVGQTFYIGTTQVAINRASNALTLAGITLTTPDIGTPSAGTLTNCTSLPISGLTASTITAIGVGSIELGHASDCTIARTGAGQIQVEGVVIPTISSTNTLTNKRITQRVVTTTDDATAVIDIDVTDVYELSAVANATEFTTTGTPTDGQKLIIRLKDAGVAKALTWTGFTAIGVTLPATTTAGKWHYIGATYNLAATAWHAIAVSTQA
jgi:hypothetical protein